jgi:hypothetical protein
MMNMMKMLKTSSIIFFVVCFALIISSGENKITNKAKNTNFNTSTNFSSEGKCQIKCERQQVCCKQNHRYLCREKNCLYLEKKMKK